MRGLACGLVAGLLAGVPAFLFGEPLIDEAIAIEDRLAEASGERHEAGPVSRDQQHAGLFVATGLYGLAVGGMFGIAFAALRGRIPAPGEGSLAVGFAGVVLVAGVLVPFLKYPANPPAVGDPETIDERTVLFYVVVAASLLSVLAAWRVARSLRRERPAWARAGAGTLVYGGTVAAAFLLLPGIDEAPEGFPPDLLQQFRWASLSVHLVLWSSLGLLFALAARRAANPS